MTSLTKCLIKFLDIPFLMNIIKHTYTEFKGLNRKVNFLLSFYIDCNFKSTSSPNDKKIETKTINSSRFQILSDIENCTKIFANNVINLLYVHQKVL